MKETTNMSRAIGSIQSWARAINRDWFSNELPMEECIWTVQSTPTSYGHFTPYTSWGVHSKEGERGAVEINLGAGTLDRPVENTCATMIHEMVHWYNYRNNVKDCSRGNTYHNKRFRDEAEKHGIHVSYDPRIGWSITEPSDELILWIADQGFEDIRLGRNEFAGLFAPGGGSTGGKLIGTAGSTPRKSNSIKWVCPCCGTIVRSTKVVNIICGDCNEKFVIA